NKESSSRVVTQFLSNIFYGRDITLVDGGAQKRCFLYIDDAIVALARIIENKNGSADGRIINIGHPGNEASIAELAQMMLDEVAKFPDYADIRGKIKIIETSGKDHYGKGYQDIEHRVPNVSRAKEFLGWEPTTPMRDAVAKTIAFYMAQKPDNLTAA
ncbi:MAG: NAD-dependent epimerase/dehydratase family protein, partial [Alphaproteobacteria bacterium]|nr:NAD-dependent epimerase/dehydratase family protein [Alphaproteobacteria bacterium]